MKILTDAVANCLLRIAGYVLLQAGRLLYDWLYELLAFFTGDDWCILIGQFQAPLQPYVGPSDWADPAHWLWRLFWGCHDEGKVPGENPLPTDTHAHQRHGGIGTHTHTHTSTHHTHTLTLTHPHITHTHTSTHPHITHTHISTHHTHSHSRTHHTHSHITHTHSHTHTHAMSQEHLWPYHWSKWLTSSAKFGLKAQNWNYSQINQIWH